MKLSILKSLRRFEAGKLTARQAAKIANLPLIDWFSLASSLGISVVNYDPKEIDEELKNYYE